MTHINKRVTKMQSEVCCLTYYDVSGESKGISYMEGINQKEIVLSLGNVKIARILWFSVNRKGNNMSFCCKAEQCVL